MLANFIAALAGLVAGMLINYLADILPVRRRIARPVCLYCGTPQRLPNYLLWPRRCPNCGRSRGARVWVVEGLAVVAAVWFWNSPEVVRQLGPVAGAVVLVYFAVVVVIDVEHRLILHPVSRFGAVMAALIGVALHGVWPALIGGVVGYGVMLGLYYLGHLFVRLVSKIQGKPLDEVALGFGDVNLSGVLGLLLGWPNVLVGLFLSILLAGFASLVLVLVRLAARRFRAFIAIPYGPFLIGGAVMLLYFPAFTQKVLSSLSPLLAR